MSRAYVGIDTGTSSVKVIMMDEKGNSAKVKVSYEEISPRGWCEAVVKALSSMDYPSETAIGLSSQVGTYIINDRDVISWNAPTGSDCVAEVLEGYDRQTFVREISMMHPAITSYPIPRLKYIARTYGNGCRVCQPKDIVGNMLTGTMATDKYSWRGLANMSRGEYSDFFLREVGSPKLPPILGHMEKTGVVTEKVCALTGIPEGTPVYTGLNDFYASLIGMGIDSVGDMFDITGTSEHLGVITDSPDTETTMVSSPYTDHFVHYGVTASGGTSLSFAKSVFGGEIPMPNGDILKNAPIFLPYLNGERAPIFDSDARGTFFGIGADSTREMMAYSVAEGVVFSIYHIYENLGKPSASSVTVSGGASEIDMLNRLKAEMFAMPVYIPKEQDTSALGALIVAARAQGSEADFVQRGHTVMPEGNMQEILLKRYDIYKKLYPALKSTFKDWKEL